ncbi:MAG: hypothetical protein WBA45_15565 [Microthrixaceae bacterium]
MRARPSTITRIVAPLILVAASITSCGDGTPAFCSDLASSRNLNGVVTALKADDLSKATSEANRLKDLASKAPSEIRADLKALANGVVDIIDLVKRDLDANSVSEDKDTGDSGSGPVSDQPATESDAQDPAKGPGKASDAQVAANAGGQPDDEDTQSDIDVTDPGTTEPTDVEQRRNELNTRLGELDERSENVSNWALQECGIKL